MFYLIHLAYNITADHLKQPFGRFCASLVRLPVVFSPISNHIISGGIVLHYKCFLVISGYIQLKWACVCTHFFKPPQFSRIRELMD